MLSIYLLKDDEHMHDYIKFFENEILESTLKLDYVYLQSYQIFSKIIVNCCAT